MKHQGHDFQKEGGEVETETQRLGTSRENLSGKERITEITGQ
jgi:hypothetical protein